MAKTSTIALLVALVTLAFTSVVNATNNYPIILVHGLAGFGRGEAFGIPYWGTLQGDFQEKLKSEGYTVYTVAVGKVSSDWDRAVELYAQIKGGTVDYGANHSATYGHKRYGRTYPGYFPQWGTVVNGKLQKVHLIGHSMGGTTIRMLTQMLNTGTKGSATEEDPASHPLFAGGKDWVHSVSTLSTPIVGSTLADFLGPGLDLIKGAIATTFGIAGLTGDLTKSIYDPILDQWGITPKAAGESLDDYLARIAASKLYAPGNPDNAGISLAVKTGAKAQNKWVKTLPNVYYYSFVSEGTYNTRDLLFQRIALPNTLVNNPLINPLATLMGSRNTIAMGFTDDWLANDGFVNVIAQGSDLVSKVIDFAGTSQRGAWVRFKTLRMDHTGLMGTNPLIPVYPIYKAHAALLADLPAHEALTTSRSLRGNVDEEAEVNAGIHDAPQAIVQAVFAAQDPLA